MLKIRLQRTGKRGQSYFRVIVVEHTKKPKGKFLELLGNYDPHKKKFKVNMERLNHRISNGAQVSPTVNNLLVNYEYWDKPKMPSWKPKKGKTENEKGKTEPAPGQPKQETAPAEVKTEAPQPSSSPSSETTDGTAEDTAGEAVEPKPAQH